jgi:hypothetical protein
LELVQTPVVPAVFQLAVEELMPVVAVLDLLQLVELAA